MNEEIRKRIKKELEGELKHLTKEKKFFIKKYRFGKRTIELINKIKRIEDELFILGKRIRIKGEDKPLIDIGRDEVETLFDKSAIAYIGVGICKRSIQNRVLYATKKAISKLKRLGVYIRRLNRALVLFNIDSSVTVKEINNAVTHITQQTDKNSHILLSVKIERDKRKYCKILIIGVEK